MLRQDPNDLSLEVSCLSLLHYKNVTYPEWPMLYTTYISDCIGIGYRHTPSQRFGLYHSVSEHVVKAEQLTDDLLKEYIESVDETFLIQHQINASFLIRALHEFIEPIEEAPLIEVFLHVNEERSFLEENNKEADADFTNIKLIFDAVCRYTKKAMIPIERFHVLRGRETFILPAQGDANLHLRTYPRERQEELAKWVALHIEYLLNQKTEKKRLILSVNYAALLGLARRISKIGSPLVLRCVKRCETLSGRKHNQIYSPVFFRQVKKR